MIDKRAKEILAKTGYTTEVEKTIVYMYIEELEKENQQLKEENNKIKIAITENCDLRLEVLKYKEVIEEVRGYVDKEMFDYLETPELLQILDKVEE